MPYHALPIYLKITPVEFNDYKVGGEYEIRYEDEVSNNLKDEEGPFNYAHEALLISKQEMEFGDVNPILIAFLGNSRNAEEALEEVCARGEPYDDDRMVNVLTFLRIDKAKEFVIEGYEKLETPIKKEMFEA